MNGEHKTGDGTTGTGDNAPGGQADTEADREARARQDVTQHPRMQAMAAIAQKHEQDIEDQLTQQGLSSRTVVGEQEQRVDDTRTTGAVEDNQQREEQPREQQPGDEQRTQQQPAQQPAKTAKGAPQVDLQAFGTDPVPMESLDNLKVKVKIDGQERVLTLQELRRTAQIDGAAMARLEQANALLRQAQEAAQRTQQQPPVGVEGKTGSGDSSSAPKGVTEAATRLVDALFVGDKDAAVETLSNFLNAQPTQEVDTDAITRRVGAQVKQQLSQEEAEAQFRSEFKDVVADPILVSVADRFFAEAQAADPQKSYAELLSEAGNATRAWYGERSPNPATGPGQRTPRQEKLAAKGNLDEPRGLNRTEVKTEPTIPTHSDVIAQMRKDRGLA